MPCMKSFFLPLTEFLSLIWLFMLIGVGFHLWRRQWRSAAWLGIPTALLFLLGSTPLVHPSSPVLSGPMRPPFGLERPPLDLRHP